MNVLKRLPSATLVVLCVLLLAGCARAARDTTGFALVDEATVDASFDDTWQAAKAVLREMDVDIYTRDKRGAFVAFSRSGRRLFVPQRVQYTLNLEPTGDEETSITVETVRQVYGVTLLTYPGWHDRETTESQLAQTILAAIKEKVAGASPES